MDVEQASRETKVELLRETAEIHSDGLLLYVAQATYEPGTSPLSLWVPAKAFTETHSTGASKEMSTDMSTSEPPLDIFERYALHRTYVCPG